MPFAYYARLPPSSKAVYRQSDRIVEIRLSRPELLASLVEGLRLALAAERRPAVELAADHLCRGLTEMLGVAPVRVRVLAVRPTSGWGELHGLYPTDPPPPA